MPVGNACAYGHNAYTTQPGTTATRMLEDRLVLGSNFEEQTWHSNGYAKTVVEFMKLLIIAQQIWKYNI